MPVTIGLTFNMWRETGKTGLPTEQKRQLPWGPRPTVIINMVNQYTGVYKTNYYELQLSFGIQKSLNAALTANLTNTSNCNRH